MPPRPRKPSVTTSKLLEAIEFVSMACKETGPLNETHLCLSGQWAAASNGVITIATKIQENLNCCPQSKLFQQSLTKCGDGFAITQLEKSLSIKAGKFKAIIPCIDPMLLTIPSPDNPVADINDSLKAAFGIVGTLVNENAQNIVQASILLNGPSVVATDRKVMIEYWHGIDLPKGLTLPKTIVAPLNKTNKKLSKLGFSNSSLTFYFEDESWIKCQLYVEKWPDISSILDRPSNQMDFPKDFWTAFDAVVPFSDEGLIYFDAGTMRSHDTDAAGASFECPGLPKGPSFSAKQLAIIRPLASTVDFFTPAPFEGSTMLTFFGKQVRGAIAGRT